MKLKELKSHFVFNRSQRFGVLFLLALILINMYVYFFVSFTEESTFDISSKEVILLQKQMDSMARQDSLARLPKRFPFNPNFLTDYKAYSLGMPPDAFDRLLAFRAEGKWVNSASQFKKVTGISDSLLNAMSPYFKFPEWVTRSKSKSTWKKSNMSLPDSEKKALNQATVEDLDEVYGVGAALSYRIIEFRAKINGFHHEDQLYAVWGLSDSVVARIKNQFKVVQPASIQRYNLNTVSASDLSTLPGVSFELGKRIWEFVRVREGVSDLSELLKIEGVSTSKLQLFRLYLYTE